MTSTKTHLIRLTVIALLLTSMFAVPVQADHTDEDEEGDEDSEGPVIDFSGVIEALDNLTKAVKGFFNHFDDRIADLLKQLFYKPFQDLAKAVIDLLTVLLVTFPDVASNDAVQEVHQTTFTIALAFASPAVVGVGLLYMTGELFNLNYYSQVRILLPRLGLALIFGAVAPDILQIFIDLSELTTLAFEPVQPSLSGTYHLVAGLIIVTFLNAFITLGIAVLLIARNGFFLLATAMAPLIAVAWAVPYFKQRFADPLIGIFWGFIITSPVMMIILRLTLSMMQGGETIPRWLTTLGMLVLLFAVPLLLLKQGAVLVGIMSTSVNKAHRRLPSPRQQSQNNETNDYPPRPGNDARHSRYGDAHPDYNGGMLR